MADAKYNVELIITDPHGQSSSLELGPGEYTLGRADDCDVRFPASANTVSRNHAKLIIQKGLVRIRDLDSRSGIMLNGQVIREGKLEDNDVITLSKFMIRVQLPEGKRAGDGRKAGMVVPGAPELEQRAENLAAELKEVRQATQKLNAEIAKRIVGQQRIVRSVWATILAQGHCLMVGVPGLAKTFMVTTFADALGLSFKRIQFTPDLMPADIIGSNVIQEDESGRRHFEFVQGPIFTQLLLADEINRTPPKTQAALLEAMQERQVTVANRSLSLPSPFCVIASQNPIEQEGTYPLPEAQQDRFMLCVILDYPGRKEEVDIVIRTTQGIIPEVDQALSYKEILRYQRIVDNISVGREMAEYAADLARATRPGDQAVLGWVTAMVDWGAGPRAGQALIRGAKALAAMDGRPAIASADIQEIALPVLRHRICCNYRARTENMNEDRIVARILKEVKVP